MVCNGEFGLDCLAKLLYLLFLLLGVLLDSQLKAFLELDYLLVEDLAQVIEGAFPVFALVLVQVHLWSNNEEEILVVLLSVLLLAEHVVELAHDA